MVVPAPADGFLRPMHKLWVTGGDRVDFLVLSAPASPIVWLAREDDIGGMLVSEFVTDGSDCWSNGWLLVAGGGWPAGGGGTSPSPLEIRVSQWHFRVVWLEAFAPLWNLQGASRACS